MPFSFVGCQLVGPRGGLIKEERPDHNLKFRNRNKGPGQKLKASALTFSCRICSFRLGVQFQVRLLPATMRILWFWLLPRCCYVFDVAGKGGAEYDLRQILYFCVLFVVGGAVVTVHERNGRLGKHMPPRSRSIWNSALGAFFPLEGLLWKISFSWSAVTLVVVAKLSETLWRHVFQRLPFSCRFPREFVLVLSGCPSGLLLGEALGHSAWRHCPRGSVATQLQRQLDRVHALRAFLRAIMCLQFCFTFVRWPIRVGLDFLCFSVVCPDGASLSCFNLLGRCVRGFAVSGNVVSAYCRHAKSECPLVGTVASAVKLPFACFRNTLIDSTC